ncbi:hypothetical protein [Marinicrinis lubricantis]|uniref:Uncharacterized protein n=1 Tax=Marinicrinis lubricantis TaxID=2086470 RepID=A0ABW1IUK6_9BACL
MTEQGTWLERRNQAQSELLSSLVDGQQALNRMLHCAAEVYSRRSDILHSEQLLRELQLMCRLQQQWIEQLTHTRLRHIRKASPGRPWLRQGVLNAAPHQSDL